MHSLNKNPSIWVFYHTIVHSTTYLWRRRGSTCTLLHNTQLTLVSSYYHNNSIICFLKKNCCLISNPKQLTNHYQCTPTLVPPHRGLGHLCICLHAFGFWYLINITVFNSLLINLLGLLRRHQWSRSHWVATPMCAVHQLLHHHLMLHL